MNTTIAGNYRELIVSGKDIYGFKKAYSIRPIKLTASISYVSIIKDEATLKQLFIGVGFDGGIGCLLPINSSGGGFFGGRRVATYQVVVDGASHIFQTDEKRTQLVMNQWCRKFM